MAFDEVRFNTEIRYGLVGGPEFNTDVIEVDSGFDVRNSNWDEARGMWKVGDDLYSRAEIDSLIAFFRARKGKARGFRLKDWADFFTTTSNGVLVANSAGTFQTKKKYSDSGNTEYRTIFKLVSGTVHVYVNGVEDTGATIDYNTGLVTLSSTVTPLNILGITQANPGAVNCTAHGLTTGTVVWISGVLGMTQVNNHYYTITVVDADHFTIGVNTTTYSAYTSGGTVSVYPQSGATLTWAGQFDVPVRFDTDKFECEFAAYRESDGESLFQVVGLPMVELRMEAPV